MGIPRDPAARRFYLAAGQRLNDAKAILKIGRTTAAVYLAGYCVECMLKALVLEATPSSRRPALLPDLFTHNLETLRGMYLTRSSGTIPRDRLGDLVLVRSAWDTQMRYEPGPRAAAEAKLFVAAVERLSIWAKARF